MSVYSIFAGAPFQFPAGASYGDEMQVGTGGTVVWNPPTLTNLDETVLYYFSTLTGDENVECNLRFQMRGFQVTVYTVDEMALTAEEGGLSLTAVPNSAIPDAPQNVCLGTTLVVANGVPTQATVNIDDEGIIDIRLVNAFLVQGDEYIIPANTYLGCYISDRSP